jgi:hypothetical protein
MSITLATIAALSINGAVQESDANAALTYMEVTFPTTMRLFFTYGNMSGGVFTPGTQLAKVIVTVNLQTSLWSSSNGLSGAFSNNAVAWATFLANLLAIQNTVESTAVNASVIPGTDVPWTSAEF